MGSLQAIALAQDVAPDFGLETASHVHLASNHYPPVSPAWIPTCTEIVEGYDDLNPDIHAWLDEKVKNPVRKGETVSRRRIIEALHLDAFLTFAED